MPASCSSTGEAKLRGPTSLRKKGACSALLTPFQGALTWEAASGRLSFHRGLLLCLQTGRSIGLGKLVS